MTLCFSEIERDDGWNFIYFYGMIWLMNYILIRLWILGLGSIKYEVLERML